MPEPARTSDTTPFAPRDHARARRLVARFLDPSRRWDAESSHTLDEHIRACEPCRAHYNRLVTAHRAMLGSDLALPSAFEQSRRLAALLPPTRPARRAWGVGALGLGLASAAAAIFLLVGTPTEPDLPTAPGLRDLQARRGSAEGPLVGLDITGVSEGGDEYEVLAAGSAGHADWLRLAWTNERRGLRWLFVFGLQPDRAPIWYAPLPDEARSFAITTGRLVPLDFELRVAERHALGELRIVALFTPEPVRLDQVTRFAREARPAWGAGTDALEAALRDQLGLAASAEVTIHATVVRPGSRREVSSDAP